MKKTLLCGLLAAAALSLPVQAARNVPVQVDGEMLPVQGRLMDGATYVPLRTLLEAYGGWELEWDSAARQAVGARGVNRLAADPAADTITVDGVVHTGSVYVERGLTYVPLRTVAEAFGGKVTWDAGLGGASVITERTAYSDEDLYWLSRIISAESRGEPMEGQIAVGNVVLNRVASSEFPNTIKGVIFDEVDGIQFEPVENGTVYLEPTEQSVEAARRVLAGEQVIGECMFFYAPALSEGTWINANRTYYRTIGCHRFYL